MKKYIYSIMIFAAALTSCGGSESENSNEEKESTEHSTEAETVVIDEETSSKGNWTNDEIEKAKAELEKVDDQLAAFGDKKEAFKECYLQKIIDNYDNFNQANVDLNGCSMLAEACSQEVLGL